MCSQALLNAKPQAAEHANSHNQIYLTYNFSLSSILLENYSNINLRFFSISINNAANLVKQFKNDCTSVELIAALIKDFIVNATSISIDFGNMEERLNRIII